MIGGWRTRKNGKLSKIQHCSECGARYPLIHGEDVFISSPEPDDWLWIECDGCGDPICFDCSEEFEEEGLRLCVTCLQCPNTKRRLGIKE